jgi:hypothetical protein
VNWFTSDDVRVYTIEDKEVGWRSYYEPLEESLVKGEDVTSGDARCVYFVWADLSKDEVEGCECSYCAT